MARTQPCAGAQRASADTPDSDASEVVIVFESRRLEPDGAFRIDHGSGGLREDHLEERREIQPLIVRIQHGVPVPTGAVHDGELQLLIVGA